MKKQRPSGTGFPSKHEIAKFIDESPIPVGRREIARAFGIRGSNLIGLKRLLVEMGNAGKSAKTGKPAAGGVGKGELPPVMVVEITGRDIDGELLAQPFEWRGRDPAPAILIVPGGTTEIKPPGIGDRVLARLSRTQTGYEGQVIRLIAGRADAPRRVLGVYQAIGRSGRVQPVEKGRDEVSIERDQALEARSGELVMIEM